MDGLIAAIIVGVVVTAIGAILAFYFGGVRERQKREYERQQEEQRRLEEQQEEQQRREEELNKRRAEALAQIQAQASVVVEHVKRWGAEATVLPEIVDSSIESTGGFIKRYFRGPASSLTTEEGVQQLLLKYSEVVQQRDSIAAQMDALKLYYRERAPSLLLTARSLIESFNKDFDGRYKPLSSQLQGYPWLRRRFKLSEDVPAGERLFAEAVLSLPVIKELSALEGDVLLASLKSLREEWAGLPETASHARDWDFGPYQVSFEKEIEKLTSGGP